MRADKSTVVRTIITMPLDDTVPPTWISVALVGKADIGLQQIEEILEVQRRLAQLSLMRIKVLLAGPNAEFAMESLSKDWERWSGGAKGWRKVWAPALDIGFGRASATHTHTHLATMLERVETIEESKGEIVSGMGEGESRRRTRSLTHARCAQVRAYFGDSAVNAFVAKPLAEKIDWPKLPFPKAIDGK